MGGILAIAYLFAAIPFIINMKGDFAFTCSLFKRRCIKKNNDDNKDNFDMSQDDLVTVNGVPALELVHCSQRQQMEMVKVQSLYEHKTAFSITLCSLMDADK